MNKEERKEVEQIIYNLLKDAEPNPKLNPQSVYPKTGVDLRLTAEAIVRALEEKGYKIIKT